MKKFARYFIVGGIAAGVDFSIFGFFLYKLSLSWFWAAFFSFLIATSVNYFLSIRHVFVSGVRFRKSHEMLLVFFVSGVGLAINQLVLYLGIALFGVYPFVAKVGATGVVFLWNYASRTRFIFR